MTRKISQVLREARDLIADPKHWTRGAMEWEGSYCAVGAVRQATAGDPHRTNTATKLALEELAYGLPAYNTWWQQTTENRVIDFNDRRGGEAGHARVLRRFDRTIARLEARGE